MNAVERRKKILKLLQEAQSPVSGTALARMVGVSRQIIVQDMALLRAQSGEQIISTFQGYVLLKTKEPCKRVFKVRHGADKTQQELQEIVDLSGKVEDVFVYHSVYGIVRGQLGISSRRDVKAFMERLAQGSSTPLMQITDDFHYHTVSAEDEMTLDQIEARLKELGFLAPLREHEPEGVKK